jgi:hypothetical protein
MSNTMLPKYRWQAVYKNGDITTESKVSSYEDIDRSNLRFFQIIDPETTDIKLKIEILEHQSLIWRRRYSISTNGKKEIAHLVGKQTNQDGKNYQWIALLFESDGRVEFFDKFNPNSPFLNEMELFDFE